MLARLANSTKTGSSNSVPGMLCSASRPRRIVSRPKNLYRTSTYAVETEANPQATAATPATSRLLASPRPRSAVDQIRT